VRTAVNQSEEVLADGSRRPVEVVSTFDDDGDFLNSTIEPIPGEPAPGVLPIALPHIAGPVDPVPVDLPTVRNPGTKKR
jgi:hypothetical protein